jgi:peptide/nickel transport system permease protein
MIHRLLLPVLRFYATALLLAALFMGLLNRDDEAVYLLAGQQTSETGIAELKRAYALDKPYPVQVAVYFHDLLPVGKIDVERGGIGFFRVGENSYGLKWPWFRESLQSGRAVHQIFARTFPATLVLALFAMLFASVGGILLGMLAAARPGAVWERPLLLLATTGMALPSFFSAIVLAWLFGFIWHSYTGLYPWGSLWAIDNYSGETHIAWKNVILPAFTLGIRPLSVILQMTRNSILNVNALPHVRTAKAKGLSYKKVYRKHIVRNALLPVFTSITNWLGGMLAGAVFVEFVFGWQGIGKEIIEAVQTQDFVVVIGGVLGITAIFSVLQFLTDSVQVWLDPRGR